MRFCPANFAKSIFSRFGTILILIFLLEKQPHSQYHHLNFPGTSRSAIKGAALDQQFFLWAAEPNNVLRSAFLCVCGEWTAMENHFSSLPSPPTSRARARACATCTASTGPARSSA